MMSEHNVDHEYDGIGTPLELGKMPPPASDGEIEKIVFGRPDPRDLYQLTRTSERIEQQLLQESEERKAADAENMAYTKKQDAINRRLAIAGLVVAILSLLVAIAPYIRGFFAKP